MESRVSVATSSMETLRRRQILGMVYLGARAPVVEVVVVVICGMPQANGRGMERIDPNTGAMDRVLSLVGGASVRASAGVSAASVLFVI
jgi:hypothetical protein